MTEEFVAGVATGGSLVALAVGVALGTLVTALGCSVRHSRINTPLPRNTPQLEVQGDEEAREQLHMDDVGAPEGGEGVPEEGEMMPEEGGEITPEEQPPEEVGGNEREPTIHPCIHGELSDTAAYSSVNRAFSMKDPDTPPETPPSTHSPPTTPSRTQS